MNVTLVICVNSRVGDQPSCGPSGGEALADRLEILLKERNSPALLERILCLGQCWEGPNLRIAPRGPVFHHAKLEQIPEILQALEEHIAKMSG
ncbi:MAG: (2Fe-2S) ferredoxin domain-containing protein [Magnetococcales bacterium]|nr:(2Fe-2S) ferredoxin domain-containing protein [Magnetococcales bacterium]